MPLDELLKLAGEFSEGGRLREAERILDRILSSAPDEPLALHEKGVLLFRMGHQTPGSSSGNDRAPCQFGARRDAVPPQLVSDLGTARPP